MSDAKTARLIKQDNHHPWFDDDTSFVTQVLETESHEVSEQVAEIMNAEGWSIYLVANTGTPSIVVYRKSDNVGNTWDEKTTDSDKSI